MTHYDLVAANQQKSALIVVLFTLFAGAAAYLMAVGFGYDLSIVGWALIFSGVSAFGSYYYSDKIILGISGAHPANRKQHFDFFTVTENICLGQRLPLPKLYVIDDTALNAFATGRDPQHATVCVTSGLLAQLNRAELEGVVAHELSHVRNYDIRLMSVVTVLVGLLALLSDWLLRMSFWGRSRKNDNRSGNELQAVFMIVGMVLALLSPLVAQLIQLAISRQREFLADAAAVGMTRNPAGLINALKKISQDKEPLEAANKATAHLYISDPLKNNVSAVKTFAQLFSTHPPVEERIRVLQGL